MLGQTETDTLLKFEMARQHTIATYEENHHNATRQYSASLGAALLLPSLNQECPNLETKQLIYTVNVMVTVYACSGMVLGFQTDQHRVLFCLTPYMVPNSLLGWLVAVGSFSNSKIPSLCIFTTSLYIIESDRKWCDGGNQGRQIDTPSKAPQIGTPLKVLVYIIIVLFYYCIVARTSSLKSLFVKRLGICLAVKRFGQKKAL